MNESLPPGAKLLEPHRRSITGWIDLIYDAQVERCGVTWYRLKGSSCGQWVADLRFPTNVGSPICVMVQSSHWEGGKNYGTFDNACKQQLLDARKRLKLQFDAVAKKVLHMDRLLEGIE